MSNTNIFFLFLSCEKYKHKREKSRKNNIPYRYKYFIGNDKISQNEEDDVIVLDCKDNYESLTKKTLSAIKWINENEKNIDYIIKTDDDVTIDVDSIDRIIKKIEDKDVDYAGELHKGGYLSFHHKDKCEDKFLNKTPMYVPNITYCIGGAYILSKKAVKAILSLDEYENYYSIYEDATVGNILNAKGIKPVGTNIKKYFKWE